MIAPMEKVLVAGRALDRREVLEAVREAGVVHVEPVAARPVKARAAVREELRLATRALEILAALGAPSGEPAPEHTPPVLVERVLALHGALEALHARRTALLGERRAAEPWGRFGAEDVAALRQAGLRVVFAARPPGAAGLVGAEVLRVASRAGDVEHVVAVARGEIAVEPPARAVAIPPRDVDAVDADLSAADAEQARIGAELAGFVFRRGEVREYRMRLEDQERFLGVEAGLLEEGEVFVLKGWVPAVAAGGLREALGALALPVALQVSPPAEDEQPPTTFQNRSWCRPIERIYGLLGVFPGYRERDISFLFLPALTVFTGFLIADAGYAAVVLLGLAVFSRRLAARGTPRAVLDLAFILFGGVLVFGALTNTWFGEPLLRLTPFDGGDARWQERLQQACFLVGAVHLSLAHLLKIWGRPPRLAMLAEAGWILFIWAMLALVNQLVLGRAAPRWMVPLFQVSLGLVLLFTAPSRNPLRALGAGLGAIALSAASFLSDIISYIRLWAVGLAGGILAASFNELAGTLPLAAMILILVPAHLLNLALGLVAVFAHGVRLNLLEFSNHVGMEWGGREYEPFRRNA